jgi:RNA polymerase sigma-70 factor (ECF subfamily)
MISMIGFLFGGLFPLARRSPAALPSDGAAGVQAGGRSGRPDGALAEALPGEAAEPAVLVERALAGERRAFDELYRLHVGAAYRLLTRLVGATPDRDDLIQQVFLEAFRSLPGFRGDAAFSTWLHRIVVHVAYRYLRRAKPRWDEALLEPAPHAASPEAAVRQQEELARAMRYLSALKPDKRIAFVLRVVDGMSLEEIGALVGANAPAVGQRVKHAQRELAAMAERDRLRAKEDR